MATEKQIVKGDAWLTMIYPESEKDGWQQLLKDVGMKAIISPLHDGDFWPDGTPKKAHYHVMLLWDSNTTYNNARRIVDMIGGVGCLKCESKRGSARYWCHLDEDPAEKVHYDIEKVVTIGNVDYQLFITTEDDDDLMLGDIFDFCTDNVIWCYKVLVDYCRANRQDWYHLINHKFRENVWKYLRSFEYQLLKEGYFDYENQQSTDRSK